MQYLHKRQMKVVKFLTKLKNRLNCDFVEQKKSLKEAITEISDVSDYMSEAEEEKDSIKVLDKKEDEFIEIDGENQFKNQETSQNNLNPINDSNINFPLIINLSESKTENINNQKNLQSQDLEKDVKIENHSIIEESKLFCNHVEKQEIMLHTNQLIMIKNEKTINIEKPNHNLLYNTHQEFKNEDNTEKLIQTNIHINIMEEFEDKENYKIGYNNFKIDQKFENKHKLFYNHKNIIPHKKHSDFIDSYKKNNHKKLLVLIKQNKTQDSHEKYLDNISLIKEFIDSLQETLSLSSNHRKLKKIADKISFISSHIDQVNERSSRIKIMILRKMLHIISIIEQENKEIKMIINIIIRYIELIKNQEGNDNVFTFYLTTYLNESFMIKYYYKVNDEKYFNLELLIKKMMKHIKEEIQLNEDDKAIFDKMKNFPTFIKLQNFYRFVKTYTKLIKNDDQY